MTLAEYNIILKNSFHSVFLGLRQRVIYTSRILLSLPYSGIDEIFVSKVRYLVEFLWLGDILSPTVADLERRTGC